LEPWLRSSAQRSRRSAIPKTMELLANAADTEAIMADLEERAAEGDQSAKDCLAAKTGAAA
jgi:hypothetical protein